MKKKTLIVGLFALVFLSACDQKLNEDSVNLTVKTYVYFREWYIPPFAVDTTFAYHADVFVYRKDTPIRMDTSISIFPMTGEELEFHKHYAPDEDLLASSIHDTVHHLRLPKGKHIMIVRYDLGGGTYASNRYYFRKISVTSDDVIGDTLFGKRSCEYETLY